jgi:hypothetical protein
MVGENARRAADMVGNLVTSLAAGDAPEREICASGSAG